MTSLISLHKKILAILGSSPKTLQQIADELAKSKIYVDVDPPSDELREALEESDEIWETRQGLFFRTDMVLEGICLTHMLSKREIEHGVVDVIADLYGIHFGLKEIHLEVGGKLKAVFGGRDGIKGADESGSFLGPQGWLAGYSAGDYITFQRIRDKVRVFRPERLADGKKERDAMVNAFTEVFDDVRAERIGVSQLEILMASLCSDPALFRSPVPPISQLLDEGELEVRGDWVGPKDRDWKTPGESWLAHSKEQLFETFGFSSCCRTDFEYCLNAWKAWRSGKADQLDRTTILEALAHSQVALCFASWTFQFETMAQAEVISFMSELIRPDREDCASGYYLRSLAKASMGDALGAEQDLVLALGCDADFEPAMLEYANYAADRGDILGHISRLRRLDPVQVQHQLDATMELLPSFPPTERNAPCPCGSGMKYKSCCLKNPKLDPASRRSWITRKIVRWMARPERREYLGEYFRVFELQAPRAGVEDFYGFVFDIAIYEGGGAEEYLELRSELLEDEDRRILEALVTSVRSLYEVVEVFPGEGMVFRDTLTGDTFDVTEHLGSMNARVGDYLLTRIIPSTDPKEGLVMMGETLTITLQQRASVLELLRNDPDPFDFLTWMASTLQLPTMVNYDGESIVLCQTIVKPDPSVNIESVLSENFDRHESDIWVHVSPNEKMGTVSSGLLKLEGGKLTVETNSRERMEALLKKLSGLLGDYEVLDSTEQSIASALENYTEDLDRVPESELPEELREFMNTHIEEMENKWIDESIPALGGLTPKQALSDPTRREDLFRLLNEFERDEAKHLSSSNQGFGFNTERIRRKLGL